MKKITKFILICAVVLSMIPIIRKNTVSVSAEDKTTYTYYAMSCKSDKPYEVDTVTDSGTFENKGCYVDFASAKTAMTAAGADAVVRHAGSYTANQIIAMTRGYVYSASRAGSDNVFNTTVSIYQTGSNAAHTYVNLYQAMYYKDTVTYNGDGTGEVAVNAFGFEGNVSMKQVDFIPEKFYTLGLAIWVGGNEAKDVWQVIPQRNHYEIDIDAYGYKNLCYLGYSDRPGSSSAEAECIFNNYVGVAADWMTVGSLYYSHDDAVYYSDPDFKQTAGTYYNYYLYLPLRSKSNIAVEKYNTFLQKQGRDSASSLWDTGKIFLANQASMGINAAMIFAQACGESGYGSYLCAKNNLFGVGAYDGIYGAGVEFASIQACIDNQMGPFLTQYTDPLNKYGYYYGGYFGNKGSGIAAVYASDAMYGLKLASMYYGFDRNANNKDGNLTDYLSSCLGVLNDTVTSVYSDSSGSNVLYTTQYGYNTGYQKNAVVVILGETGDYYKVQSTVYVVDGARAAWSSSVSYNWDTMVGYIKKADVKAVVGTVPVTVIPSHEMYRMYNPNSGEHFYTKDSTERDHLISVGWTYEGVGWYAPETSNTPVYRLYNPNAGEHHYTTSADERDHLVSVGWIFEGIGWYSDDAKAVPLYREYNPNAYSCNHNYTTSQAENDWLVSLGWKYEGIGWYGVNK